MRTRFHKDLDELAAGLQALCLRDRSAIAAATHEPHTSPTTDRDTTRRPPDLSARPPLSLAPTDRSGQTTRYHQIAKRARQPNF
ncbi:hypothetical protein [Nocardia abscessus]|uniref:hypothetical protein n=1 Tax=Nocardia abscessus TaxID=120957 RepID=UPI00245715EC|nr:hypothetical protein [Nocardia abscessus]